MKYIASCSFGKDSVATILLAREHNEPLDEIVYCEVMFDKEISGELPEHRDFIYNKAIPTFESWGYKKVILRKQFPLIVQFDMKGKEIIKDLKGKRMYKPSNKIQAALYKAAQHDFQCAYYECQKCGWMSKIYVP